MAEQRSRYTITVVKPSVFQGVLVIIFGAALATTRLWLPRELQEEISFGQVWHWALIAGVIIASYGVARAGWRHGVTVDLAKRLVSSKKDFFGIGKGQSVSLDDIHSVKIKQSFTRDHGSDTAGHVRVRYQVTIEGPKAVLDAGSSGYYEVSRDRAEALARVLRVDLHDLTG